ncbi:SMP-30/gluconolactonase/LRE family protein [Asanoa sp. WMMD1127]|uniref:SMP-30/gluconolactonase/LRE family protein n=1 Tax=Asanoa sp. WMMD1127 TaxID=3016107 RepID=UPI002417BEFC|nr:SMP-30/gluconolactonase/LRE family protein [Asanoa sp. WMMD1127]MDG4823974.1 SMP-30/gluconolactonase/LRE family protein [Asanoa sp. WMMD1127]
MSKKFRAEEVASGFGFLEGPRWRGGKLWASDFNRHQVFVIDPGTGSVDPVGKVPHQPSGLAFSSRGDVFVVSMVDRQVLRLRDGAFEPFADLSGFTPHWLNDMVVDSADRLFVSSFGLTLGGDPTLAPAPIVRVDPDGSATVVSTDLTFPNGLVFNANGSTLYVADTFGARLATYAVSAEGALSLVSFHDFAPATHQSWDAGWESRDFLPDGLASDSSGRVWAANANGSSVAWVEPATGDSAIVDVEGLGPDERVYALAFDEADNLFACVAPRVGTWDIEREFPSRLVRLHRI